MRGRTWPLILVVAVAGAACDKKSDVSDIGHSPAKVRKESSLGESKSSSKTNGSHRNHQANAYDRIKSRLGDNSSELTAEERAEISDFFLTGSIEECKKLLSEMPIGANYNLFLMQFTRRFASEDLVGAISWLKESPEEASLQAAYSIVGSEAAKDPGAAEAFISAIKDSGLKYQFSTSYVRALLNADNGPARLREIVNSEAARSALGLDTPALILALGTANTTQETTGIILESMKSLLANDTNYSKLSATAIADMVDPHQAQVAEFISKNADAIGVAEVFTQPLMASWGKKDPIAAATWLQTQEGKSRDQGIIGLVSAISNLQPVDAMQWAISASDPASRRQAVGTVASTSFSEIERKKAVIMESNLSDEEKESYVKLITR